MLFERRDPSKSTAGGPGRVCLHMHIVFRRPRKTVRGWQHTARTLDQLVELIEVLLACQAVEKIPECLCIYARFLHHCGEDRAGTVTAAVVVGKPVRHFGTQASIHQKFPVRFFETAGRMIIEEGRSPKHNGSPNGSPPIGEKTFSRTGGS